MKTPSTFTPPQKKWLGFVFVLVSAILFSSKGVIIKLAYAQQADALTVLTFRMIMAAPFYLLFLFNKPAQPDKITPKDYVLMVLLGVIGYYLSSYTDFLGLQYISANLERIILFIYPTFVTLLSFIIFKKPIRKIGVLALVVSYSGVMLAMYNQAIFVGNASFWGMGLVLSSAFTYALYMVYSDSLVHKFGTIAFTARIMLISAFCVAAHYIIVGDIATLAGYSSTFYLACFILAIFGTVLPSFLATAGIQWIGAKNTALVSTLGPVWTILLAYMVLSEPINTIQVAGTALVVAGVLINQFYSK